MAMFDAGFEFLDDEAMFTSTGTKYAGSTAKTLDWQAAGLEMGAGEPVWFNMRVGTTAFAGAGNIQALLTADTAAGGHDASSTEVCRGPIIAVGATTSGAGAWLCRMPLPVNADILRYLGAGVVCTGAATAGTVDAWLDHGPQSSFDTQVSTSNVT
jgi:hypothetical protein